MTNEPDYQIEIIKELALKNNIPFATMRKIAYSPYRFVKEIMQEGNANKIMINGFIHFSVNPVKKKNYLEWKLKQDENGISE